MELLKGVKCCDNDCKTPQELLDHHLPNDCFPPVILTEILPSTGTTTSENILGKDKRWWEFWK